MHHRDGREDQTVADRDQDAVEVWVELVPEGDDREMGRARQRRPERRLPRVQALVAYDFFRSPFSSYS
jgi:hypothetical protein